MLYEERADQLAAWGRTLGFDIRQTADTYIVRLSETDSNLALWQTGDGFAFGTGFRNDAPLADVTSASFDVVFRYATWHLVGSQGDLLSTVVKTSSEPAPGFTLEPGPESDPPGVHLRSPAGWSALFTTPRPAMVAATFSHVASLTPEEIRDLL